MAMTPKDVAIAFWRGASPQTWSDIFGPELASGCCVLPDDLLPWCGGDESMVAYLSDATGQSNIRRGFVRQVARWFWPHRGRAMTWTPQQMVEGRCLGWAPCLPEDIWPSDSLRISGELAGMDWEGGVRVKNYGHTPDEREWLLIWAKGGQNGTRCGWVRKDTVRQWAGQYGDDAVRYLQDAPSAGWDSTVWRLARLFSECGLPASPGLGVETVDVYAVDPVVFGVIRDGEWYAV